MPPRQKSALKIQLRPSGERGHFSNPWLQSAHTFSFASYKSSAFQGLGTLKVVNEDRIKAAKGFGEHEHADYEIWTYLIKGELEHRDSMGNVEIIKAGSIQMTSAGSGISHSEFNRHPSKPCHLLQLWSLPSQSGLSPTYYTRTFPAASKRNKVLRVVAPITSADVSPEREGEGPVPIHASLTMFASLLPSSSSISHLLGPKAKSAYLHLVQSTSYRGPSAPPDPKGAQLRLNDDLVMEEGDSLLIEVGKSGSRELRVESTGKREAEWVLVEME